MLHRGNSIVQVVDVNKVRRTLIFYMLYGDVIQNNYSKQW